MANQISTFLGQYTGILNTIVYSFIIIIFVSMCIFIWWKIKTWKAYNIQVRIYSKRKEGFKTWDDWGGFVKNKKTGEVYGFRLKKLKIMIQPPNYDYLVIAPKGNVLHLYQRSNDEFFVLFPAILFGKEGQHELILRVLEGDIQLWATTMIDRLYTMYSRPTFFEKYGHYIIFFATALLIIIMIYLTLQKFDVLKDVANSFKESVSALRELKSSAVTPTVAPK
jgi:hypothetical protein